MSTDALKEALLRQKTAFVETDALKALAALLELPEETVARVTFAFYHTDAMGSFGVMEGWARCLSEQLQSAIHKGADEALLRARFARAIRDNRAVFVAVKVLLPNFCNKSEICNGCPERIECMAENLHQPIHCYDVRHSYVSTRPVRLTEKEVVVECDHPRGIYTLKTYNLRQYVTT